MNNHNAFSTGHLPGNNGDDPREESRSTTSRYHYQEQPGPRHRHRPRRNNNKKEGEPDSSSLRPPKQQPKRQPKRKNRPGHNSYLKIRLDEAALQQLYNATKRLEDNLHEDNHLGNNGTKLLPAEDQVILTTTRSLKDCQKSTTSTTQPSPLRIRPRSLASLHLTFFFGGECLAALSEHDLTQWHGQVQAVLRRSGFIVLKDLNDDTADHVVVVDPRTTSLQSLHESEATTPDNNEEHHNNPTTTTDRPPSSLDNEPHYWLKMKRFRLFPPGRRSSLVVAELEASPAFHQLHRDIRQIAQTSNCPELVEIAKASEDIWIPHVTLANIAGRNNNNKEELQRLQSFLDQMQPQVDESSRLLSPASIGMGGPIPTAAALDWNFYPVSTAP